MMQLPTVVGCLALATLVLAPSLAAQKEASTLAVLTKKSDAVLVVRVQSLQTRDDVRYLSFKVMRSLAGRLTLPQVLSEPAGEYCGSALAGLARGNEIILFLTQRGGRLHLRGGARSILPLSLMLEKAVRSLISKKQDGERIEVLSLQIDETDKRISEDACLALAIARGLEQADPVSKNRIRNALAKSIESPGAGVKVSGLLSAMLRVDRVVAAKTSWQLLLDKKHKALHGLAEQTLSRSLSVTTMLKSAPPLRTLDDETCRRVLNLLGNRKSKLASPLVRSLLENSKGQARKFAAMTLLRLGSSRKDLERSYGQELAKDAALLMEQRRARRKSRFRAIFKRGAR